MGPARQVTLRCGVFFNRLGEIRDRSFEQQRHRASGLNLVTAAIVLWNTVYLERAVRAIRQHNQRLDETLCKHLSHPGWEHINLKGDYVRKQNRVVGPGKYRPLRPFTCLNVHYNPFSTSAPMMPNVVPYGRSSHVIAA